MSLCAATGDGSQEKLFATRWGNHADPAGGRQERPGRQHRCAIGIATTDAPKDGEIEVAITGVYELPKAVAQGDLAD